METFDCRMSSNLIKTARNIRQPDVSIRRPGPIRHGEVNDEDSERNSVVSEGRSVRGMMIISPGRA
ncbi:hypothetical protein QC761_0032090 [Podospora bellae-mahoneyi]|uniref:Uncharacterized protein n=1 Tax=Podospora bellae-mahoneyi TaxID=2093777 RepID=A0ABR0FRI2_9PEZI|nr:hypothetical protein QC761_0032090 [Podospora bellae-mahoneyi]